MYKTFTKDDLKNRMVVETPSGRYMVIDNYLINENDCISLDCYNYDLSRILEVKFNNPITGIPHFIDTEKYLVTTVYKPQYSLNINNLFAFDILWRRSEVKEVTMTEIEEKFGCKVKIINDKNT